MFFFNLAGQTEVTSILPKKLQQTNTVNGMLLQVQIKCTYYNILIFRNINYSHLHLEDRALQLLQ